MILSPKRLKQDATYLERLLFHGYMVGELKIICSFGKQAKADDSLDRKLEIVSQPLETNMQPITAESIYIPAEPTPEACEEVITDALKEINEPSHRVLVCRIKLINAERVKELYSPDERLLPDNTVGLMSAAMLFKYINSQDTSAHRR